MQNLLFNIKKLFKKYYIKSLKNKYINIFINFTNYNFKKV